MQTLSLAMIVKDEEMHLDRCLGSVKGLVDEIVVVDTGSADGTRVIADRHGARVFEFSWQHDFSAARNASLARCTSQWVLVLDADEALREGQFAELRRAIENPDVHAYRLILRNRFRDGNQTSLDAPARLDPDAAGTDHAYYADGLGLRLCRKLGGLRFDGRIHELLDPFFLERGIPIGQLPVVVDHYGKLDAAREREKRVTYLALARQDALDAPDNHQYQFNLLQQAVFAGDWPTALAAVSRYLELQAAVPPMVLLSGGMALQALGQHERAVAMLDDLLKSDPAHAVALTRKAVSLAFLGDLDQARDLLRAAIREEPGFTTPRVNLAELEGQGGQYIAAREVLEEGLRQDPQEQHLWNALIQLSVEHQNPSQACLDAWKAIQRCPGGGQGSWHLLVACQLLHQGNPGLARNVLDSAPPSDALTGEMARVRARIQAAMER